MTVRFEIRRASGYQPYFARAVAVSNGNVLMHSETYAHKSDAIHVANIMKKPGDQVVDYT